MPTSTSPDAALLLNALLLDPEQGKQEWLKWRAEADLESLDSDSLSSIPLLFGRLSEWLSEEALENSYKELDPCLNKIFGICKRGWALNQLRYRELADVWKLLQRGGIEPVAIGGCAAWALRYWEEKAIRPISCLDIVIRVESATMGAQALRSAGWIPELDVPVPEARLPDLYDRLWFSSPSGTSLRLTWRPRKSSLEWAADNDTIPCCEEFDLLGTATAVLATEELLLDALTRTSDDIVSWKCDAILLERNRSVDWQRFSRISRNVLLGAERLAQIRDEYGLSVPNFQCGSPSSPRP